MGLEDGAEKISEECFEQYLKNNFSLKQIEWLKEIGTINLIHHGYIDGFAKGVTTTTRHIQNMIEKKRDNESNEIPPEIDMPPLVTAYNGDNEE